MAIWNPLRGGCRYLNVRDFGANGDGATNDTDAIQRAVDTAVRRRCTIVAPPGVYMIDAKKSIRLPSHSRLEMAGTATLKALPTREGSYAVIDIARCTDVTVIGGTVCGERVEHQGTDGQWGVVVRIRSATDITIESVTARECWGDGFYIGRLGPEAGESQDVRLIRCVADGNRRQGCSIVSLIGGLVQGCTFRRTGGTAPECGLNIEPNEGDTARDILIAACMFLENRGCGLSVWSTAEGCIVTAAVCRKNRIGMRVSGRSNLVSSCQCRSNEAVGISVGGRANLIVDNVCVANGYANIVVGQPKDSNIGVPRNEARQCAAQGNLCRGGDLGSGRGSSQFGLLVDRLSSNSLVANNDLLDSAGSPDNALVDRGEHTVAENNRF